MSSPPISSSSEPFQTILKKAGMLRSGERTWCDESVTTSEDGLLQTVKITAFLRHPDHTWKEDIKMQLIWCFADCCQCCEAYGSVH